MTPDDEIKEAKARVRKLEADKAQAEKEAKLQADRDFEQAQEALGLQRYIGIGSDVYEGRRGDSAMLSMCLIWAKDIEDARAQAKAGVKVPSTHWSLPDTRNFPELIVLAKHLHRTTVYG